ncbi:serine hydrolase FLP [Paenibacillus sp. J22TS3]|nr:serine hydrolase FLP [Paenibacillus sp. J22TS3]
MFVLILMASIVLIPDSPVLANSSSTTTNTSVDSAKIDDHVESMIKQLQIPGVALGIVKGDQIVYLKGYGTSGPDGDPITPQTPFVLGSTSKSFTALSIMQLVEQGKIDLNAPVQQYLPNFKLADPKAAGAILVKDLLHQVSGLSTYEGRRVFNNKFNSIDELATHLDDVPLSDPVGSTYHYSNLNYDLLGSIIQAVSGQSYAEYVQEHIFNPLDMKNSFTSVTEAQRNGLAKGYQSIFGYMIPMDFPDNPSILASGYLISSAEDMAHYLTAQLNNGKYKNVSIASPAIVSTMHQPYAKDPSTGHYYGMGWEINDNIIQHNGAVENFHSDMILDGDTAIVVLINAQDFLVRGMNFSKIASGVQQIMKGQEPTGVEIANVTRTYVIIDFICVIIVALIAWSIYNLFKKKKKFTPIPLRITVSLLSLLIFNLIIPVGVLLLMGRMAPWNVVFTYLPGIGHFIFIICILLLGIGAIKTFLLIQNIIKYKMKQKNPRLPESHIRGHEKQQAAPPTPEIRL